MYGNGFNLSEPRYLDVTEAAGQPPWQQDADRPMPPRSVHDGQGAEGHRVRPFRSGAKGETGARSSAKCQADVPPWHCITVRPSTNEAFSCRMNTAKSPMHSPKESRSDMLPILWRSSKVSTVLSLKPPLLQAGLMKPPTPRFIRVHVRQRWESLALLALGVRRVCGWQE